MLEDISTRPYFIQAVYQWCIDKKHTPYIVVHWREKQYPGVPLHLVSVKQHIVFNISLEAVQNLVIGKEGVFFTARFIGKTIEIAVPLADILAVYAMEEGKGISFPVAEAKTTEPESEKVEASSSSPKAPPPAEKKAKSSNLHVV